MTFICPFHIWDVILPIDEFHHFSRWFKPPTRDCTKIGEKSSSMVSPIGPPWILFELDEKKSFFFFRTAMENYPFIDVFSHEKYKKLHLSMGFSMDFPCPGGQTRHPGIRCHGVGLSIGWYPLRHHVMVSMLPMISSLYTLWLFDVAMENPMDKWRF